MSDVDVRALRGLLDGEHADIRDRVRERWFTRPESVPPLDVPRDEYRELVLAWAREIAAEGDTSLGFPPEYGGGGQVGAFIASFETLAFGDLSLLVKCGVQFGLWGGAVLHLGTRRHHEALLRRIMALELPGAFAMTESGHGSNVAALETTATYDPKTDELVVHTPTDAARKDWIGNALHGRMAAVFAQLVVGGEARGVHALVVPLRDEDGELLPGVHHADRGTKLGLEGVDNGRLWFDQVRVGRDALLDRYAQILDDGTYVSEIENPNRRFFTMLGTLVQGRISICGASVAASKVALTIAVRHALERRQFGPPDGPEVPLLHYRTHQRRLLVPLAAAYALTFAQERLVAQFAEVFSADRPGEAGDPADRRRRELETLAAGLKAVATWQATETIQGCREACGGIGYSAQLRFAALKADTDVFTTFEGDNTVLLQLCAKNLLTDFRDEFGELDPLGTATFVAGQVVETLAERTGVSELLGRIADGLLPGRDDERDLLERDAQLDLLRWRQEHLLQGAARRLKGGIDAGADPFEVLVDCQDHVVACARAWVDLVVAEAFAGAVERCEDEATRTVLDRLCSLHVLARIEADRGWYQEHGRLSSPRSKRVIKAVNALCGQLRDEAGALVDAFGVPHNALRAAQPEAVGRAG